MKVVNLMMWNAVKSNYSISPDFRTWRLKLPLPLADEVTVAEQAMHIAPITPAVCMFDNHPNNHDDKKPNIKRIVFFFQPIINKPFMKE